MIVQSRKRAFSLVELVIVVVIIGVIAAIAVPRISRGAKGAGESALRGSLASLRNAIDMYSAEHGGTFPGADNVEATLIRQLTEKTDVNGVAGGNFGPYLRRGFPPCPVGPGAGATGVIVAATGPVVTATPGMGWVYNSVTGAIIVNTNVADDSGVAANTYDKY
jgi:prepilin-type N-terminal cleavage/methylation domain-containing protein